MPLHDHFHLPMSKRASWEEVHGLWPGIMAMRLNELLPPEFRSGVKIHLGSLVEVDAGAFEYDDAPLNGAAADEGLAWQAATPTLLLDTDELTPPEYEVRVYDETNERRLVAAVEIVSPRNKDRADSRDAFVSKCHAMLQQHVCVVIVDPVTERSGNLWGELAQRLGAQPPTMANVPLYAVSCRTHFANARYRVEAWEHELTVGAALPTLPLWISDSYYVPLELESTYQTTLRGLRLG